MKPDMITKIEKKFASLFVEMKDPESPPMLCPGIMGSY